MELHCTFRRHGLQASYSLSSAAAQRDHAGRVRPHTVDFTQRTADAYDMVLLGSLWEGPREPSVF
jgi:hypothetical protein